MLALLVFTASGRALADEDPRIAKAQAIFGEGLRLASDHREGEALKKFEEAYGVYPSPNILAAVGRQKQLLGQNVDAIRDLRAALRDPLLNPENASRVRAQIQEVETKIARLRIEGPRDARVSVDGREHALPLAEPIDTNPGPYRITASLAGKTAELRGEAKAGLITAVTLSFDDAGSGSRPPIEPHEEKDGARATGSWVGLGLLGVGVASVAVGSGFLVARGSSASEVTKLEELTASRGDSCAAGSTSAACSDLEAKRAERDRNGSAGTALVVGGAVFAVAGAVMFFVWPRASSREARSTSPRILAGPRYVGAELSF